MSPGDIFLHRQFAFSDGGIADKFFVVLGEYNGTLIATKTTSKGHRYRNEHGCQAGNYFAAFMLTKGCCSLPRDTWVCLSEFYEFLLGDLTTKLVSGTVYAHGALSDELTLDLQLCAAGCDDISQNQEKGVRDSYANLKVQVAAKTASLLSEASAAAATTPATIVLPSINPSAGDSADSAADE